MDMFDRLEDTVNRYEDITAELGNPDVVNDQNRFRKLMKEQSSLAPLIATYTEYKNCKQTIEDSLQLLDEESDEEENQQAVASALSNIPVGNYNGSVKNASISEQETKPPARYTQASLLSDMSSIAKYVQHPTVKKLLLQKDQGKKGESGSIGTPATRHAIIGELIKAGYLYEEKKGKRTNLISTELGREFYDVLPDSVRKVDVSAKWWY